MSVRVVARIRPLLEKEHDKDVIVRAASTDSGKNDNNTIVRIPSPKNNNEEFSFAFNAVYDQATSQEELFNAEVSPYIRSLFQALDVTIFAYGVTGTGKTHTMRGGLKLADRGVIPRLLSGVFRRGKKIMKDSDGQTIVRVSLSYYEIYNDKVFDLLEPPENRSSLGLPLRAEANGRTVVWGLSERACEDLRDFEKLYIEANNNRVTASTKLNAHSSRSHAILRVKLTQITDEGVLESTASCIDLAGSEDNRRTDNGKERLVESAAINKSLFVLSQCIDAISRGDKRIPYRESKMTRILSLGQNNGITVMILNLAPMRSYHLDTLSSLNVSSRAKRIEVREIENEIVYKLGPPPKVSHHGLGGAQSRQPLRLLTNAHNVQSGNAAAKTAAEVTKPVKAFNVYIDKSKSTTSVATRPIANSSQVRSASNSHKRPSDQSDQEVVTRPGKIPRPGASMIPTMPGAASTPAPTRAATAPAIPAKPASLSKAGPTITVSAADIEAMVEKKVQEILAARSAAEQTSPQTPTKSQPDISDALQRRLEALERRVETNDDWRDDSRSEGLRLLLAARQAKDQGDNATALKMYEMALPFFPGQTKLLSKIERLRMRLAAPAGEVVSPRRSSGKGDRRRRRTRAATTDEEGDYEDGEADIDEEHLTDTPVRPKPRKSKSHSTAITRPTLLSDDMPAVPATPRAQQLLDVVNSRDLVQIRSLPGFGARKARDLVDHLELMSVAEDEPVTLGSLEELRGLPGVSRQAVDMAYDGLVM